MIASGAAWVTPALSLNGSFVVQAGGTAYFYNSSGVFGATEVLHFTMAGSASFSHGSNTAFNITLNLGGEDEDAIRRPGFLLRQQL